MNEFLCLFKLVKYVFAKRCFSGIQRHKKNVGNAVNLAGLTKQIISEFLEKDVPYLFERDL